MPLRRRQVHLDFHTSEHIEGIGRDFDPERFADTFKRANVDSATLFSRCHHGWIYHETDKFPELKHPHLERDLLTEQIRALHKVDIKAPVYITVGWDERAAREHPEWREVKADGRQAGSDPLSPGWRKLDFLSPYIDFVCAQTKDVVDRYGDELDGFFFDIIFVDGAHSEWALAEYRRLGLDPRKPEDVEKVKARAVRNYLDRIMEVVPKGLPVFHNSGHVSPSMRPNLEHYSHLELESLPTGGWGYAHFPTVARYSRTVGKEFLGMTGKFSETWGHFQSYKPVAALEFECLSAVALGGACSVGDQLPPNGVLDERTYDLIGAVYGEVARREEWSVGGEIVKEIAMINVEGVKGGHDRMDATMVGAMRALTELGYPFDFVDDGSDLTGYRLLILGDKAIVDSAWVSAFVAGGGRVIVTGESTMDFDGSPAKDLGPLPHSPDYLVDDRGPIVMYERGQKLAATGDVAATVGRPEFDRTVDHFCSHAHAPYAGLTEDPAIVRNEKVSVYAHPILETYGEHSMPLHRDLLAAEIARLIPDRVVEHDGPKSIITSLVRKGEGHVLHLLHYIPERRGLRFDVVEDRMPVVDLTVRLRVPGTSATLQPHGTTLETGRDGDVLTVKVPLFAGHAMVVVA